MSIASEIDALKNRVKSAYDALQAKGATMPSTKNTANMPSTINSIQTGGAVTLRSSNNIGESSSSIYAPNVVNHHSTYIPGTSTYGFMLEFSDGTTLPLVANQEISFSDTKYIVKIHNYESCLSGDTLITMSDGSIKRVDELKVGDKVLSIDPLTCKLAEDEVVYSDSDEVKYGESYDVWTFDDHTEIITINPHEFYNVERQRMTYIAEFSFGDRVYKQDGTTTRLRDHKSHWQTIRHFTLFTKNWNNYFANGILTGNRKSVQMNIGR